MSELTRIAETAASSLVAPLVAGAVTCGLFLGVLYALGKTRWQRRS